MLEQSKEPIHIQEESINPLTQVQPKNHVDRKEIRKSKLKGQFQEDPNIHYDRGWKQNIMGQKEQFDDSGLMVNHLLLATADLTHKQRLQKAVRHIRDAINLRTPRNDLEIHPNKIIFSIYTIQQMPFFQFFLTLLAFSYMFISIWEPANRKDTSFQLEEGVIIYESIMLSILMIELIMETIHLHYDIGREWKDKYLFNYKFLFKFIFIILLVIDFAYFYSYYKEDALRIARYIRPLLMLLYNKELRRTFKSIVQSFQQIIQLFLFFTLMTFFWAVIGFRIIGDLDNEVEFDEYSQNFANLGTASNILYALISFDGYPDCMLPSIKVSKYYFFYFLIYLMLYLLIFTPIPVAIVFETFRSHRCKLIIYDRIKQREALLAAFITLDENELKTINYVQFYELMAEVYYQKKRYLKIIKELYGLVDDNNTDSVSINEFFELIECIESDSKFSIPSFPDYKFWDYFRNFMNRYLRLKQISNSVYYEMFMFIILIMNSVVVIASQFTDDERQNEIYDQIDNVCLYFYIIECVIKIIGLGIIKYFEDSWNVQDQLIYYNLIRFDFSMVILSLFSNFLQSILSVVKSAKSVKSGRLLKITKINKMFKAVKALRTVRIVNVCVEGANILIQLKIMIQRIFLCIPMIIKLIPVMFMIFYFWAILGIENFNTKTHPYKKGSQYLEFDYATMNNFLEALMLLFQVSIEANWSSLTYDIAYKFDDFYAAMVYFCFFHLIIQLIMISLVKGIVWEIFTVVEQATKEHQRLIAELESKYETLDNITEEDKMLKNSNSLSNRQNNKIKAQTKLYNLSQEYDQIIIALMTDDIKSSIHNESPIQLAKLNEDNQSAIKSQYNFTDEDLVIFNPKPSPSHFEINKNVSQQEQSSNIIKKDQQVQIQLFSNQTFVTLNNQVYNQCNFNVQQDITHNYNHQCSDKSSIQISQAQSAQRSHPIRSTDKKDNYLIKKIHEIINKSDDNIESFYLNSADLSKKSKQKVIYILLKRILPLSQHEQNIKNSYQLMQYGGFDKDFQIFNKEDEHSMAIYFHQLQSDLIRDTYKKEDKINQQVSKKAPITRQKSKLTQLRERETKQKQINQQIDNDQQFNQNFVLKKALLKETNPDMIKKIEADYFFENYGAFFQQIQDLNLNPILKHEAYLLRMLQRVLKYQHAEVEIFFETLAMIEKEMTQIVLRKGSFFKFVFQDSYGNWFSTSKIENEIKILKLEKGIWNYQSLVWEYQEEIYVCRDFFQKENQHFDEVLNEIYDEFQLLTYSVTDQIDLYDLPINQSLFDLFLYYMSNKQIKDDQAKTDKVQAFKISFALLSYRGQYTYIEKRKDTKRKSMRNQSYVKNIQFDSLKNQQLKEFEKLSEQACLPFCYIVEMLQDLQKIIETYKTNFFFHVNQILNNHVQKLEKEF